MIKYPDDYNPIKEYWEQIKNKEVIVCDKLYRTYQKVINDMENPKEFFIPIREQIMLLSL